MSPHHATLRVDGDRLWALLDESATIGATSDGGVRRLALSAADREIRDRFADWCRGAGCSVDVDAIGNVFARRPGRDDHLAPVVVGSHLDTQVSAGRFDGALGVLAGVELVRTLNDHDVTLRRPLEIVSWTNEEGARFRPTMMGSGVFAGAHALGDALAARDDGGISVAEALAATGYSGALPIAGRPLDAYFELHIEQGPQLEAEGVDIGVVTAGWPTCALAIAVTGTTAHAGPTPMSHRRNALFGAARIVLALGNIALAHAPSARTTTTRIECWPNCLGIVPARVRLDVDLRHCDGLVVARMVKQLEAAINLIARDDRLEITIAETKTFGGMQLDAECVALIQRAADGLGLSSCRIQSQAGHDAYHLSGMCPTGMIFIPCRGGISHNPDEWTTPAQVEAGANVLLQSVVARAGR